MKKTQDMHSKVPAMSFFSFSTWVVLAFFGMWMTACEGGSTASSEGTETETTEETTGAEAETTSQDGGFSMTLDQIEELKAKFTYNDEIGYYEHNYWGNRTPTRRTLTAIVNQTGYFVVKSIYYGENPPNHSRVIVTVGDQSITTDRVDLKSNDHQVVKDAGKTFEINNYTQYRDKGIFEAIGKAAPGTEVNIRFDGPDTFVESAMPENDFTAVKDCYHLSLVLRAGM